jgi:hypothetical protein
MKFTEVRKGVFQSELIERPAKDVSIPIVFQPPIPFCLTKATITEGWDIEYVHVGNILITAYRKSRNPICLPNMTITTLAQPFMWKEFKRWADSDREDAKRGSEGPAVLTLEGELIDL